MSKVLIFFAAIGLWSNLAVGSESGNREVPNLGLALQDVAETTSGFSLFMRGAAGKEITVVEVAKGGDAERAEIRRGDVLIEINGQKFESAAQAVNCLTAISPGSMVKLLLKRGGSKLFVAFKATGAATSKGATEASGATGPLGERVTNSPNGRTTASPSGGP